MITILLILIAGGFGIAIILAVGRAIRRALGWNKLRSQLRLHDVGIIIDRALGAYRRQIGPALLISAVCLLFGNTMISNQPLFGTLLSLFMFGRIVLPGSIESLARLWGLLSILGLGQTLLSWGVAAATLAARQGRPITLAALLPRGRLRGLLGLALLKIIPALLAALIGWIGVLAALLWGLAPIIMLQEGLGPWAATRRSTALVWRNYSALLNTVVPLWLIGWLLAGTPLALLVWLLNALGMLSGTGASGAALLGVFIFGQLCVAPITEYGAVSCYYYLQERAGRPLAELEQAITTFDAPHT